MGGPNRMNRLLCLGAGAACLPALSTHRAQCQPAATAPKRILVVGSVNVDLIKDVGPGKLTLAGTAIDISAVKGQTLPSSSFLNTEAIACQLSASSDTAAGQGLEKARVEALAALQTMDKNQDGVVDATEFIGGDVSKDEFIRSDTNLDGVLDEQELMARAAANDQAEKVVLTMEGPFTQVTGGKGANAAAAVGQTCAGGGCVSEFIGQFGAASSAENIRLLVDLKKCSVDVSRSPTVDGPTGTAFILQYDDRDNAIVLIGGANQAWPSPQALSSQAQGEDLRSAITEAAAVMLQREIPEEINILVARLASEAGIPVIMDVGGHDRPLDPDLMPYISVIAPNESELVWISGVETTEDGELSISKVHEAAAALRQKFADTSNPDVEVLVTLGSEGAIYFDKSGGVTTQKGFQLGPAGVVDTTGAGDCYRGTFVAARYGRGMVLPAALRWAASAGSLAVEVPGAMPSMPPVDKIATRLEQQHKGSPLVFQMSWQKRQKQLCSEQTGNDLAALLQAQADTVDLCVAFQADKPYIASRVGF